ncbi:MAG: cbb3-type cytochrome c oxidase subunit 3 [Polyangiaceae bacterium]|nr:cbb3-type cytochrome c oxidase subunit 3 [Polyangiaceae bacterium]
MKLSDVMSAMRLETYAEIAMVLFMLAFAGVVYQLLRRRNVAEFEHARQLPLSEDLAPTPLSEEK